MKLVFTDFLRKCQYPLLLASGTLPLILLAILYGAPNSLGIAWVFPVIYLLAAWACLVISGKGRVWCGVGATVVLLALGIGAAVLQGGYGAPLVAVIYSAMLLGGLQFAVWSWKEELPSIFYLVGIALHVTVQIWAVVDTFYDSELAPIAPWCTASFVVFALTVLLAINRSALAGAAMQRQKPSASVRWKNTVMVVVFFLIVLFIASAPALGEAVRAFFAWLGSMLASGFEFQEPETTSEVYSSRVPDTAIRETGIPDPTARNIQNFLFAIIEFFMTVARFLLIPALIVGAVLLVVLLVKLVRWLLAAAGKYAAAVSEDYVDEITDTRDPQTRKQRKAERAKRISFLDERKLPPGERIRYRYSRLLKKHPQWGRSSTARENLPEELVPYYERARYSGKDISEEEAQTFTAGAKQLK